MRALLICHKIAGAESDSAVRLKIPSGKHPNTTVYSALHTLDPFETP